MDDVWNALYSITPTIVVGVIFWFVMSGIIRSDRHERSARAKIEAQERAKAGLPAKPPAA
ncbi:MAG: hypothetical protein ABWZ77_04620 [Naasia sp.]